MKHLYDFVGKTALVTGASSGLGYRFSQVLSEAGARVILVARNLKKLESLHSQLKNSRAIEMDVADKVSVFNAFAQLSKEEKIDICINNAGIAKRTAVFDEDEQENFEQVLQTNLMGVWYVTKNIAKMMKENSTAGSIINIASINGENVPAYLCSAYSVSKAAVIHLTKTLVGELSPHNIRINCISPGWFKTPMTSGNLSSVISHIPYGDIAMPSDLDGLILYLASNQASAYVTGANFTIDGGMSWGGLV